MTDNQLLEQDYEGFKIGIEGFKKIEGLRAHVDSWFPGQDTLSDDPVSFTEELPRMVRRRSSQWPSDDNESIRLLMDRALHRVRGAILLGRVEELAGATFTIPGAEKFAQRSDEYLRALVLGGLKRVFRRDPMHRGRAEIDDIGIGLVENIPAEDVVFILERMAVAGEVKSWVQGHGPGHRFYMPTDEGLREAERIAIPARAPGLLLEETVAAVERSLHKYSPELADALLRQSTRVTEAAEMGEHEVGEVAQACEQVVWDFLDLDVLWEDVDEQRPPRNNTRDRVRLLVRQRSPSETEGDLIEALEQYVAGWFGRLEQFIHQHRHLPGESERPHAKRIVLYTYMMLGDLITLLGL